MSTKYIDLVGKYILVNGSITKSYAVKKFGCKNLSSVIFELRHRYKLKIKSKKFCTKKWYRLFRKKWDVIYTRSENV